MQWFKNWFQLDRPLPEIGPEVLGDFLGLPITNSFVLTFVIVIASAVLAIYAKRTFSVDKPSKLQLIFETIYSAIEDTITQMAGSARIAARIVPVVFTLFIFFAVCNVFPLIPGFSSITYNGVALFRAPSSDFNMTFGVAFTLILIVQFSSIISWGLVGYIGRFIKIKEVVQSITKGPGAIGIALLEFFIGLLDIISELAKAVSLSLRLYGNIFAGTVLMTIIMSAFAFALPSVWLTMSLVFGLIQAVVFAILVAAYYVTALKPEEEVQN